MVATKWRFLLKRQAGSFICDFDLGAIRDYVAILSGRANTVRFAEQLRRELGDEPSAWLGEFMSRYQEARD
jgi:type IV secretion system protein VirB4